MGRFLQPDPLVPEPFDPQSLNRYSYVMNDPVNRIDPTGLLSLGSESAYPSGWGSGGSSFGDPFGSTFLFVWTPSQASPGFSTSSRQNQPQAQPASGIAAPQPVQPAREASQGGTFQDAGVQYASASETYATDAGYGDAQQAGLGGVLPWIWTGVRAGARYAGAGLVWAGLRLAPGLVPASQLQRLTPAQYQQIWGRGVEGAQKALTVIRSGQFMGPSGLSPTNIRSGLEWYSRQLSTHPNAIQPGNVNDLRQQFIQEFQRQRF